MNTYTSSKKIVSRFINLALLLSTTHFVFINNALAHFEDAIDSTEKIADFDPNNLPQEDIEAIKKELQEAREKGAHVVEDMQEKIDDFLHGKVKRERDEALLKFQFEKELREKSEKAASELQAKLTDKKNEISRLETELTERENIATSLRSEKEALFSALDRKKHELDDLKLEQNTLKKQLDETEENLSHEREMGQKVKSEVIRRLDTIEQKHAIVQTERDDFERDIEKLKQDLAAREQLLNEKEAQISRFKDSLSKARQDYEMAQNDISKLKDVHEEEKLTLSKNGRIKRTKLKQDLAAREQLLNEKEAQVARLTESLTAGQKDYQVMQEDIEALKSNYAQEKLSLSNLHQTEIAEINKVISEKEQLLNEKEAQVARLTESLTAGQADYEATQKDMAKLKDEHEKEKLALTENGRIKRTKLKQDLAVREQLLQEKEERVARLTESLTAGQKDYQVMQEDIEALKSNYAQEKLSLSNLHQTEIAEINKVIAAREQLLNEKEAQVARLTESLTAGQADYEATQKDMAKLKDEHEKEKLALTENGRIKRTQLKNAIAESKKLLDEKEAQIAQLEQTQYNMLEQSRDFDEIRSYFAQQETTKLQTELLEASSAKIEQLNTEYQAEKKLLKQKLDNLQTQYDGILSQADKNLGAITQDLNQRLNVAEALCNKSEEELAKTKKDLQSVAIENSNKEAIIANLQQKLTDNAQELSSALSDNGASADKIKELQNNNRSLETKLNELLCQRDQNSSKITELQGKLLSTQEERNHYITQIATLNEQNRIIKENFAEQILLQEQSIQVDNNQRELDLFSQFRELDINNASPIPAQQLTSQTINAVQSMAVVMTNSMESAVNQLYDNISSRFNWNDHISSGDEKGQVEIWVKQGVGTVSQKTTNKIEEGYKGRTHGLFIGIDHQCGLGDKNLIGVAIALNNKSKMHLGRGGQLIADNNIASVYGKYYLNNQLALSGAVSYFRANTEANNFGENIDKIKTHGSRFDLELSYNKILSNQLFQPFIGASYSNISAFDMNLKDQGVVIKKQKSRLLSGKIGTRVQLKQYNLESGINICPSLVVSISKPLKIISGNRLRINNSVLSGNNNLLTHKIKDATLNLGGDLRINRNNIDVIGSYNVSIRKKYKAHSGAIKVEVKL